MILALSAVSALMNVLTLNRLSREIDTIFQKELNLLILNEDLAVNIAKRNNLMQTYLVSGLEKYRLEYDTVRQESHAMEEGVLKLSDSAEIRELIDKKDQWGALGEKIFGLVDDGRRDEAVYLYNKEGQMLNNELTNGFDDLANQQEAEMKVLAAQLNKLSNNASLFFVFLSVGILAIGILFSVYLASSISKPLVSVTRRMQAIAGGNLSAAPFETSLKDETGQLMDATDEMSRQLKEMLFQIQEISESTSRHSGELAHSSEAVQSDTEQIAATMEELASGTETQAKTASDLAGTMDYFSTSIQSAYSQGKETLSSSSSVVQLTDSGKEQMHSSSEQMTRINNIIEEAAKRMGSLEIQTTEISKLVEVVQGIANQTNLLALNASIEAARAGEQGRGFAVVAEEVRTLAEQVSESVDHITEIVKNIQSETHSTAASLDKGYQEVEKGTIQLQQTGDSFLKIDQAVHQMATNIRAITQSLEEITTMSHTMSSSIDDIAAVSQESAAGVEETAASAQQISGSTEEVAENSRRLAGLSEKLNHVLHQFTL